MADRAGILKRWTARLTERRRLEAAARERHQAHPTKQSLATLKKRKAQVAYALRVVKRYSTSRVRINGNTVTGGTPRRRLAAAMDRTAYLDATGKRHSFYSQSGEWDVAHGITGEAHGKRSDCSQHVTALFRSCGLPDPNNASYSGGFTGTLADGGRTVTRRGAKVGTLVLVGTYPFHHVEVLRNRLTGRTYGHGTARCDYSNVRYYKPVRYVDYPALNR